MLKLDLSKKECELLAEERSEVFVLAHIHLHADNLFFAGNSTMPHETMQFAGAVGETANRPTVQAVIEARLSGTKNHPVEEVGLSRKNTTFVSRLLSAQGIKISIQPQEVNSKKTRNQSEQREGEPLHLSQLVSVIVERHAGHYQKRHFL